MRRLLLALFAAVLLWPAARAEAQLVDPPIVMRDPGVYAQVFADSMAISGIQPIRDAFQAMLGAETPLAAELEASLHVYEHPDMIKPAVVSRVLDDVSAADTYRVIYLYHYYGGNFWVFTRLEFVRISMTEWALQRMAFADQWKNVVLTTTPGFGAPPQSREPRRRGAR
jgi:hypothetical protein